MKPRLRIKKKSQIWGDLCLIYDARDVSKFSQVARALPSQVLSVAKDVDSTASLSSSFQCLKTLTVHFTDNFTWARLHYPKKKVQLQYTDSLRPHFPEVLSLEISMDYSSELKLQEAMLFPEEVQTKNVFPPEGSYVCKNKGHSSLLRNYYWSSHQHPSVPGSHITPPIWFLPVP